VLVPLSHVTVPVRFLSNRMAGTNRSNEPLAGNPKALSLSRLRLGRRRPRVPRRPYTNSVPRLPNRQGAELGWPARL